MEFYVFSKIGFKQRQSDKLKGANQRGAILIDVDIANDGKMMLLHAQKDHTLAMTFIHILGKLDNETETWTVRADEFKNWFRRTFDVGNKFDIKKRLEWFSMVDLLGFYCGPIEVLSAPYEDPIEVKNTNRDASNPLGSTRDYNQPTNQPTNTNIARAGEFEKFSSEAKAYLLKTRSPNLMNVSWVDGFLSRLYGEIRKQHPALDVPVILTCWFEICDKASAKAVTSPAWYEKAFIATVSAAKQKPPTTSHPSVKPPNVTIFDGATGFRHKQEGWIFPVEECKPRPGGAYEILHRGAAYSVNMLEVLTEAEHVCTA
jgi:hypothetical protein